MQKNASRVRARYLKESTTVKRVFCNIRLIGSYRCVTQERGVLPVGHTNKHGYDKLELDLSY